MFASMVNVFWSVFENLQQTIRRRHFQDKTIGKIRVNIEDKYGQNEDNQNTQWIELCQAHVKKLKKLWMLTN